MRTVTLANITVTVATVKVAMSRCRGARKCVRKDVSVKKRVAILAALVLFVACVGKTPGYSLSHPTEIVCGCHEPDECYDHASKLSKDRGETAATGEQLLYFSQCACFEGSFAGCNTLGHFAKDFVRACEGGDDVKNSCTIAGFVYLHGVRVPPRSGRSYDADPAKASALFKRACEAGAAEACAQGKL